MQFTLRLHRAFMTAARLHGGQRRKTDDIPYVTHSYAAAFIVSQHTQDEDIIIATILHDVIEDVAGYSTQEMTRDFGERVTSLVLQVSDPEKVPDMTSADERATWETRKTNFIEHLRKASSDALMIVAADKLHNMVSTVEAYGRHGKSIFKKFNSPIVRRQWFHGEVVALVKQKLHNALADELEQVYREANRALDVSNS
ncbi:MAG: HD domain-containing protein [Candidatus Kerfeldbacteria bacterium]|nr:HD domain-containing protein [Candidatus Kerfeldbacteria bacterium]